MNGDFLRYRGLVVVAVGAGVMIGAASVFLYQQLFGDRKCLLLKQEINALGASVAEIRRELHALRSQQTRQRNSRSILTAPSVTTETETVDTRDMFTAIGGDELDDEFYELSSDTEIVAEQNKNTSSYEEIDLLTDGASREDKTKAYGLLLELLEQNGDDDEVLWRLAKACHTMGTQYAAEGNQEKMKEFIYKGVEFGQKAIEKNSSNWKAHKWFAVCVGKRGQLQNTKEKLKDGHLFKHHVDKALAIYPNDATLHHLMGRFNFEVAKLSWIEQKIANTLFGKVPEASNEAAIKSLLEAERLNEKGWKENRLLLSRCYLAISDFQQALCWLDKAKELPALGAEDRALDKEIDDLLQKYQSKRDLPNT